MFLIAGDDRHLLREGITLIGSAENDRYSCIRLQDESICPKHAALRWSAATEELHMMDLCSHSGTQFASDSDATPKEIRPLEWQKVSPRDTILFGSIKALLESSQPKLRKRSISFFADDDSSEIVDCSLEEPPLIKSRTEPRKLQQSYDSCATANGTAGGPAILESNSFVIPATQQTDTAGPVSPNHQQAKDNQTGANISAEDENDSTFYIPETQELNSTTEAVIDPIPNTIGQGDQDDDFLRFETQDDENTGDGMFNNPYVEQSQNLLNNMDESYKRDNAKADQRKSIIPDRSVDSISFHGKIPADDTIDDLSKIEWNETKKSADPIEDREGSVTPELAFDKPREDSVTPDLEFDRITPQQKEPTADASKLSLVKMVGDAEKLREESITPDLNFEQPCEEKAVDEAEISLNQEGEIDPYGLATQPILEAVPSVSIYDFPTQKIPTEDIQGARSRRNSSKTVPTVSAYDLLTQQMPTEEIQSARSLRKLTVGLVDLKSTMMDTSLRTNKHIALDPFDIATQAFPVDEPDDFYNLQTQLLPNDTIPLELPPPSSSRKIKRKSSSNQPKQSPQMDPFVMATQPLLVAKPQTLPEDDTNDLNDTIPLKTLAHTPPQSPSDIYDLATQPLAAKDSLTSLGEDDSDMSKLFLPKVNSTYRQSILAKRNLDESAESRNKDDPNISPSSNKENRDEVAKLKASSLTLHESCADFSQHTDEGLDDEYCLAATMPVADSSSSKGKDIDSSREVTSSTKRGKRPNRKQDQDFPFKVPESSAASSAKSSINSGMETPRARKRSSSDVSNDTDAFDFSTPDHPFLNVVKKDKILAISDIIISRTTETDRSSRPKKYIFGDSSDEDDDPTVPVFFKKDSTHRVMKNDKHEDVELEIKLPSPVVPERRSNRERKRKKQHSSDDNEALAKAAGKSKKDRKHKPVDESVEYEPPTAKSMRKRKSEDKSEPPPAPLAKAGKSNRKPNKSDPEPKAGPSSEIAVQSATSTRSRSKRGEKATIKATPAVEDERKKQRGKSNQPAVGSSDDELPGAKIAPTISSTSGTDSSGGARKSSRVSKPRLMFTKMSPEPYKRMITRAAARKSQR